MGSGGGAVGASVGGTVELTVWVAAGVGNNVAVGGASVVAAAGLVGDALAAGGGATGASVGAADGADWAEASVGDTAAATGCAAGGAVAAIGGTAVYRARDSGWESEGAAAPHAKRRPRAKTNPAIKSGNALGEKGRAFLVGNGIIVLTAIIAKGTLKHPGPTGERHAKPANWRN